MFFTRPKRPKWTASLAWPSVAVAAALAAVVAMSVAHSTGVAVALALLVPGAWLGWRQARRLDHGERRARQAEAMCRAACEAHPDALFMLSARRGAHGAIEDFVFTQANGRGLRLMGQTAAELHGQTLSQRLPVLSQSGYLDRCRNAVATGRGFELAFGAADFGPGDGWLHHQVLAAADGIAVACRDITVSKTARPPLDAMARLDPLTELPNRRAFEEHLAQAAGRARRSGRALTLVVLDLDGFKQVNDTLGHAVGDQLLIEVGRRLKACVRATDQVSRRDGDAFALILEESGGPEDRQLQCERLLATLSRPHLLMGRSVVATPSLGVAVYTQGEASHGLQARAEDALHEAKRAGKACLRWAAAAPPSVEN